MNWLGFEGRSQGRHKVNCETLQDPYLLNGLKDHNQILTQGQG